MRIDFGQAHRSLGFQVFLHHLGRTLRHVGEDLVAQALRGTLQRHDQRLGLDFAQQQLDAAAVDVDDVLEDEHLVHDLLRHVLVVGAQVVHHCSLVLARHEVEDLGRGADTAHLLFLEAFVAGQQLGQHVVEFAQRGRLHAVQGCNTKDDVVAQTFREIVDDAAGMVALQVDQDGGDDLRVFVADELGHRLRVHPLEAFDTGGIAPAEDAVEQGSGLVVAQRLGQHAADVFVRIQTQRGGLAGFGDEGFQHFVDFLEADVAQRRHGRAELLDLFRAQVFHDFGGLILAQGEHEDGTFLNAVVTHCSPMT